MNPRLEHTYKVSDMTVFHRILTGTRTPLASILSRRGPARPSARSLTPRLETLETIELLSHGGLSAAALAKLKPVAQIQAQNVPFATQAGAVHQITASSISQKSTTPTQTATVPNTLTNFNQAFAPPISLFNPTLGTLVAVHVTATANLSSQITSQNLSTTTPATITGYVTGDFTISGLQPANATLTGPLSATTPPATVTVNAGDPNYGGTSTANFGTLAAAKTTTIDYTAKSDLAFFTASTGRTAISPVLVENAQAGAAAPNGNLQTLVATTGSGSVTVTYDYVMTCPPVTQVLRFGIHHQPTQLYVTFGGPLNATDASTAAYYKIVAPNKAGSFTGPGTTTVPVTSASYNAANNTVKLSPATQLNFHKLYQLVISLPCTNGTPTVIEFGGPNSLGGFTSHKGTPVVVSHGKVVH